MSNPERMRTVTALIVLKNESSRCRIFSSFLSSFFFFGGGRGTEECVDGENVIHCEDIHDKITHRI